MIKLEFTKLGAALLMRALKIAEKQERKRACCAADDFDANEAEKTAFAFNALRDIISREVKKGEQNATN